MCMLALETLVFILEDKSNIDPVYPDGSVPAVDFFKAANNSESFSQSLVATFLFWLSLEITVAEVRDANIEK